MFDFFNGNKSIFKNNEVMIKCLNNCGKTYKNVSSLNKHLKYECNKLPQFKCLFCDKMVKRPDNLRKHMRLVHGYINNNRFVSIPMNC